MAAAHLPSTQAEEIREKVPPVGYMDYDWSLHDRPRKDEPAFRGGDGCLHQVGDEYRGQAQETQEAGDVGDRDYQNRAAQSRVEI